MSLDLSVDIAHPFQIEDLLVETQSAMRELLNYQDSFPISLYELRAGSKLPVAKKQVIGEEELLLIVYLECAPEYIVELLIYELRASVSVRGGYYVKFALGAALAVAVARLQKAAIIDDGRSWSAQRMIHPDEFVRSVQVKEASQDFDTAVVAFVSDLPAFRKAT